MLGEKSIYLKGKRNAVKDGQRLSRESCLYPQGASHGREKVSRAKDVPNGSSGHHSQPRAMRLGIWYWQLVPPSEVFSSDQHE